MTLGTPSAVSPAGGRGLVAIGCIVVEVIPVGRFRQSNRETASRIPAEPVRRRRRSLAPAHPVHPGSESPANGWTSGDPRRQLLADRPPFPVPKGAWQFAFA